MASASRYETFLKLASGGMATVWIGYVRGALGFRQLVAIKKPHPHLLSDPGFRGELVAEARLASMIHHANVVDVRDVEIDGESISLVMDYIEGASIGDLLVAASRKSERVPVRSVVRIILDACSGLQAAHELVDEKGRPVGLVHRDVSPQNLLVGTDGIARVADFGVAKFSRKNQQSTSEGSLKGKLAYMAPEYVRGLDIDRRFDVFALGVVLWESLAGKRCFRGENEAETLHRLLEHVPEPVSSFDPKLAPLDAVVACALSKNADERFSNAAAMATALEASALSAGLLGGHGEVARTVKDLVGPAIEERRSLVRAKQANEPSVASLLGVPPIVLPTNPPPETAASPGAATLIDGPPTAAVATSAVAPTVTSPAAATPKQGGGGQELTATEMAASAVPTTQPMTPRMDAPHLNARPVPTTLASPLATPPELLAAAPITGSGPTAISPPFAAPAVTSLSTGEHDGTHRALEPVDIPGLAPAGSRRWVLPVVLVGALLAIGGGAFAVMGTRRAAGTADSTPASASAPAASSAVSAASTASPTPIETTTSSIASAAPLATNAAPPKLGAHATTTATTKHTANAPTAAPVPSPAPSSVPSPTPAPVPTPTVEPTPTASAKRPPPNPYGNN